LWQNFGFDDDDEYLDVDDSGDDGILFRTLTFFMLYTTWFHCAACHLITFGYILMPFSISLLSILPAWIFPLTPENTYLCLWQKVPHTEKVQDVKHTKTDSKHLLSSASIERYASFICRNVLLSKWSSSDSLRFAKVSLLIENQIYLDILVLFCILSLLPKSFCCFLICDRNSVCNLVGKVIDKFLSLPVTIWWSLIKVKDCLWCSYH
jgi:hypothetical protein